MSQAFVLHHWSRRDDERAVEAGIFEDKRVELLYGHIVDMPPPQGLAHQSAIHVLTQLLTRALGDRADVRVQLPFAASDDSEPGPDIAVVAPGGYRDAMPRQAWLIAECADSSLRKDRETKARLYAEAGVDEYWVVNLVDDAIEVHREPVGGRYQQLQAYRRGDRVALARFADVVIAVSDVVG